MPMSPADKVRKLLESARQTVLDAAKETEGEESPEKEAKGIYVHPSNSLFNSKPLEKADSPSNITPIDNPKYERGARRGEITAQKSKEKLLGITQRLRNATKGKLQVIQGEKKNEPFQMKPGLSQKEIAAANNEGLDPQSMGYSNRSPQELESEKRKQRIESGHLTVPQKDTDPVFNPVEAGKNTVGDTQDRQFAIHLQ